MNQTSRAAVALALAAIVPLGACTKTDDEEQGASGNQQVDRTLAATIARTPELSTVSSALSEAGLASAFDGPGSYTVLAPNDDAFAKLGEGAGELAADENRALLVAVLRDHILPGHVTPQTIRNAVEQNGGSASMRTLGDGTVTFSVHGGNINFEGAEGRTALVGGTAQVASNGVVIPLDSLLKTPQPVAAQ